MNPASMPSKTRWHVTRRHTSCEDGSPSAWWFATRLESLNQPIKVIRRFNEDPNAMQPDFVLIGEILQHRMVKNTNLETLPSKYRAATHEVKNEAWLSANQAYTLAQQEVSQAQHALAD